MHVAPVNSQIMPSNTSFKGLWGKRNLENRKTFSLNITEEFVEYHPFKNESAEAIEKATKDNSSSFLSEGINNVLYKFNNTVIPQKRLPFTEAEYESYLEAPLTERKLNKTEKLIEKELSKRNLNQYKNNASKRLFIEGKTAKWSYILKHFVKNMFR